MSAKILLVEDDPALAALIREALPEKDYSLTHETMVSAGWKRFEGLSPDVVVLDRGLPDEDGLELCKRIRAHPKRSDTPVIVLTARDNFSDKVGGFEAGADHYLIKPFQIQELKLWIDALLRRVQFADKDGGVLRVGGDFVIDPKAHTVAIGEKVIRDLTRKEFDLLYELIRLRPRVLSKDFILSSLWRTVLRDNTVEVHIRNIRFKLGSASIRIVTVPGVGYRFE